MNYVKGFKTYAAALALFAFATYGLATGHLTSEQAWPLILEALAIAGLRHALP